MSERLQLRTTGPTMLADALVHAGVVTTRGRACWLISHSGNVRVNGRQTHNTSLRLSAGTHQIEFASYALTVTVGHGPVAASPELHALAVRLGMNPDQDGYEIDSIAAFVERRMNDLRRRERNRIVCRLTGALNELSQPPTVKVGTELLPSPAAMAKEAREALHERTVRPTEPARPRVPRAPKVPEPIDPTVGYGTPTPNRQKRRW